MLVHLKKISPASVSRLSVGAMMLAVSCLSMAAAPKTYKVSSPGGRISVDIVPSDSLRFTVFTPSGHTVDAAVAMRFENNDFGVAPKVQ